MKKLSVFAAFLLATTTLPTAQTPVLFDHIDIVSPDFETGKAWWGKHFGGKPDSRPDHVWFGNAKTWFVVLLKSTTAKPSSQSVVDHIAFSVPDLKAKVAELEADGAKRVTSGTKEGPWKSAYVDDANGVRIELVEAPGPVGFHHFHLRFADPEGVQKWFLRVLGGQAVKVGKADALQYGEVKLLIDKGESPAPSEGSALDHLAFRMERPLYDPLIEQLKKENVVFRVNPLSYGNALISGISGKVVAPGGVLLEVLSRKPDYPAP